MSARRIDGTGGVATALLIGDNNGAPLDNPRLYRLVHWHRRMRARFSVNEGLDPLMGAATFRLSRHSVFTQTLLSTEQTECEVTNISWKLFSMDYRTGSRNRLLAPFASGTV